MLQQFAILHQWHECSRALEEEIERLEDEEAESGDDEGDSDDDSDEDGDEMPRPRYACQQQILKN